MSAPSVTELRALLREASARIAVALDSLNRRTAEVEALASFLDERLGEHCWCPAPHRGGCPSEESVIAQCDAEQEERAFDRAARGPSW